MTHRPLRLDNIVSWILAVFFVVGGVGNIVAPGPIAEEYARWGYPAWFHFVTGALELAAAGLIPRHATRWAGLALGAGVMLGAVATVLVHQEFMHALAPAIVLALISFVAWRGVARRL